MEKSYIQSLVTPRTVNKASDRKVWSIDLQGVWLPFFTATNTTGDTAIPAGALGAPLRLGYDKAGQPRFSSSGRPVVRVAKELSDAVRMVKDNFTANLLAYAGQTANDMPEAYKATLENAVKAGKPIIEHDKTMLSQAIEAKVKAEAEAKAEADKAEAEAVKTVKAEAVAEAVKTVKATKQPVTA